MREIQNTRGSVPQRCTLSGVQQVVPSAAGSYDITTSLERAQCQLACFYHDVSAGWREEAYAGSAGSQIMTSHNMPWHPWCFLSLNRTSYHTHHHLSVWPDLKLCSIDGTYKKTSTKLPYYYPYTTLSPYLATLLPCYPSLLPCYPTLLS